MSERKQLIFAPGIKQQYYIDNPTHTGSHQVLMSLFERVGFDPVFYQPNWYVPNPQAWAKGMAELAISAAAKSKQNVVLAGFSAGGLTAVLAASELQQQHGIPVTGIVGCSFSPWFSEDYVRRAHLFPTDLRYASEALKGALSELDLPVITHKAQLYVGSQEIPTLHEIRDDALAQWPNAEAIDVPCGHNVFHTSYLQALEHNIGRLAVVA